MKQSPARAVWNAPCNASSRPRVRPAPRHGWVPRKKTRAPRRPELQSPHDHPASRGNHRHHIQGRLSSQPTVAPNPQGPNTGNSIQSRIPAAPQLGDAQRFSARRRWQPSELANGHTSSTRHSPVYCSKSTNRAGVGKCAPVSQCPHVLTETPSSLAAVLIFIFRSVRQRRSALQARTGGRDTAALPWGN